MESSVALEQPVVSGAGPAMSSEVVALVAAEEAPVSCSDTPTSTVVAGATKITVEAPGPCSDALASIVAAGATEKTMEEPEAEIDASSDKAATNSAADAAAAMTATADAAMTDYTAVPVDSGSASSADQVTPQPLKVVVESVAERAGEKKEDQPDDTALSPVPDRIKDDTCMEAGFSDRCHTKGTLPQPSRTMLACREAVAGLEVDFATLRVTSVSRGCVAGRFECRGVSPQDVAVTLLAFKPGYTVMSDVLAGPEVLRKVCWKLKSINGVVNADSSNCQHHDVLVFESPKWALDRLAGRSDQVDSMGDEDTVALLPHSAEAARAFGYDSNSRAPRPVGVVIDRSPVAMAPNEPWGNVAAQPSGAALGYAMTKPPAHIQGSYPSVVAPWNHHTEPNRTAREEALVESSRRAAGLTPQTPTSESPLQHPVPRLDFDKMKGQKGQQVRVCAGGFCQETQLLGSVGDRKSQKNKSPQHICQPMGASDGCSLM